MNRMRIKWIMQSLIEGHNYYKMGLDGTLLNPNLSFWELLFSKINPKQKLPKELYKLAKHS